MIGLFVFLLAGHIILLPDKSGKKHMHFSNGHRPWKRQNAEMDKITVFMVDDHDVVRKGLRFYLNARPEITIVGEAG